MAAREVDDGFLTFAAGPAAVAGGFGGVVSVEMSLGFEAEVGEFECREFFFGRNDRGFFVVAPELVEGDFIEMKFSGPFLETGGFLVFG